MKKDCSTCKHKESGPMMHPCFPCLNEFSMLGLPKEKYDHWTDDKLTWEEINEAEKTSREEARAILDDAYENDPEFRKTFDDIVESFKRG